MPTDNNQFSGENFEVSPEYFYEFGANETNYDKPMPKKLDELDKNIKKKLFKKINSVDYGTREIKL